MHFTKRLSAIAVTAVVLLTSAAQAQLRIVDYNTAGGPHTSLDTVLQAIGDELTNGLGPRCCECGIGPETLCWLRGKQSQAALA